MRHAWIAACLTLVACGRAADDTDIKPTASIRTQVAASAALEETVVGYGVVEFAPQAERVLVAPVEATVGKIIRPAGSRVAPGDVIAMLSPTAISTLELEKARAEAKTADAADARALRLRADGLASDADVEAARSAAETADAALRTLVSRSGGALTLRSPFAGVVESVSIDTGGVAAVGASVVKVGALNGVRARVGVEPAEARRLRPGQVARLSPLVGATEGRGVVAQIDPRLDPQTRQAAVVVALSQGAFAPAEPLKAVIVVDHRAAAVVVPRGALVYEGDQAFAFVVEKGLARRRPLSLGVAMGDSVEVTRGLAPGERFAVDGAAALEDGMAVREAPAAAAEPGA